MELVETLYPKGFADEILKNLNKKIVQKELSRIVGNKCTGMLEAVAEVFPETKHLRCVFNFYCNMFSVIPKFKVKLVADTYAL